MSAASPPLTAIWTTRGVDLVPLSRRMACARRVRRMVWCWVVGTIALAVGSGLVVKQIARRETAAVARKADALAEHEVQVQRRLLANRQQRARLATQVERIEAVRRPQAWPPRLDAISRAVPEGVMLTELSAKPPANDPASAARGEAPAALKRGALPPPPGPTTVKIVGFARDHDDLTRFTAVLQSDALWQQVELVRATRQNFHGHDVLSFELGCLTREEQP